MLKDLNFCHSERSEKSLFGSNVGKVKFYTSLRMAKSIISSRVQGRADQAANFLGGL